MSGDHRQPGLVRRWRRPRSRAHESGPPENATTMASPGAAGAVLAKNRRSSARTGLRARDPDSGSGGGEGIRTPDTRIMIPLLYQLSYTAPSKRDDSGSSWAKAPRALHEARRAPEYRTESPQTLRRIA